MATLQSPGVLAREFDLSNIVPSVQTSEAAIAGVFRWGPVDQRVLVDSEQFLVSRYGRPTNFNPETWFSAASFLAYSNKLYVARAADVTGNTQEATFTGNSSNLALESDSDILQLSNTSGLSANMILAFSNAAGIAVGAVISSVNSTAVVLDRNATANVENIQVIFRENVTFTAAALQSDLNYDISDVSDWDSLVVKNEDHYTSKEANGETYDTAALFVARYPGEMGNSLRVSVCDTADQFKSNTSLLANALINSTASALTGVVGSNTLTVTITPANTSGASETAAANTHADTLKSKLIVGDLIEVGNTRIGYQYLKVTAVSALSNTANVYSFTISTDDALKLSANVSSNSLIRHWEFYNSVDRAPGQSDYVAAVGNTSANDELHMVVIDEDGKFTTSPGEILEVHTNLSRATDAKSVDGATIYYKDVINQRSQYIWWANDRTTARSNTALYVASATGSVPLNMNLVGGADGPNEALVPFSTLAFAWDQFQSTEELDISLVIQGKARGEAISHYTQLSNYLIDNIAEKRKDCVVFISPDRADVVSNINEESAAVVNFRNELRSSSYGFMDTGYKYMYDKYNDVYRWIPLNGDMAGLAARTDLTNDPWWSFAGLNRGFIKNYIKLAYNPRQADRDILYAAGVNPVIASPGLGAYLFGDKTLLKKPSAFDRINVRRLFIVLRKAISLAAKYQLFEFNDEFTRSIFRNMVNPYLRDIKGRRGITDFLVVCDATNNPGEVIDRNEFVGDIYIKPARSINFIILNFAAVRTDVSFSEVIQRF